MPSKVFVWGFGFCLEYVGVIYLLSLLSSAVVPSEVWEKILRKFVSAHLQYLRELMKCISNSFRHYFHLKCQAQFCVFSYSLRESYCVVRFFFLNWLQLTFFSFPKDLLLEFVYEWLHVFLPLLVQIACQNRDIERERLQRDSDHKQVLQELASAKPEETVSTDSVTMQHRVQKYAVARKQRTDRFLQNLYTRRNEYLQNLLPLNVASWWTTGLNGVMVCKCRWTRVLEVCTGTEWWHVLWSHCKVIGF